jgi:hypothetical protein
MLEMTASRAEPGSRLSCQMQLSPALDGLVVRLPATAVLRAQAPGPATADEACSNPGQACAMLAGVLLTVITLMTCASLIGRNTTGWTIVGDFELSGSAAGAAIALFMPWCQVRRGNIIVDFFTTKASRPPRNAGLDRLGALLLAR